MTQSDDLVADSQRRQQLRAAGGFAGLAEQRASTAGPDRLPWMLLLLDWWEGYFAAFEQYDYGRLIDTLLQTLREGAAVGPAVVPAAGGCAFHWRPTARSNEASALPSSASTWATWSWTWSTSRQAVISVT